MRVRDIFIILACLLLVAFSMFAFFVYGFSIFIVWKSGYHFIAICLGVIISIAVLARMLDE